MNYKQSNYNYIHPIQNGNELILFNSYFGIESIVRISKNDFDVLISSLESRSIQTNAQFQELKKRGFFVDGDTDEKLLCEQKYMDVVNESTLRLIIMPTEKCNFRCKYCYESFKNGKMSSEIQNSIIKYVKTNIAKYSSLEVRWFGGEPLEAIDVIENLSKEFIKICHTSKRSYMASMTTNGYNLNLNNFKKLLSLNVYNYQITIDGIKETHDSQRVLRNEGPTFDKIISNLVMIKNNIKSGIPRITIRTNFTKQIAQHLDEYITFFSSLFSNDDRFSFSFQKVADWGGESVKKIQENLIDVDFYKRILTKLSKETSTFNISPHLALMNSQTCVCYANKRNSFVIGSEGSIYKCTGDFVIDENKIGFIKDGKMYIDEKKHVCWTCKMNRKYNKCDKCFFYAACLTGSCPASFIKKQKDDICLFEKEYIGEFFDMLDISTIKKI